MPFSRPSAATSHCKLPMSPTMVSIFQALRTSTCPASTAAATASEPENIAFGRTAATNQYLLGLLVQLPVAAGSAHQAVFEWSRIHLCVYLGQRAGLHRRRRWRPSLLHQPAPKLCSEGLRSHAELRAELYLRAAVRPWSPMLNSGVGAAVFGGWKVSGIISIVSGLPFTVQTNGTNLNTPGTTQTGNLLGAYQVTQLWDRAERTGLIRLRLRLQPAARHGLHGAERWPRQYGKESSSVALDTFRTISRSSRASLCSVRIR